MKAITVRDRDAGVGGLTLTERRLAGSGGAGAFTERARYLVLPITVKEFT
jgi:hypothetical protein